MHDDKSKTDFGEERTAQGILVHYRSDQMILQDRERVTVLNRC